MTPAMAPEAPIRGITLSGRLQAWASPATAPGNQYTFGRNVGLPSPSRMTYFDGLLAPTTVAYESVERFDLDCGAGNDTAYLYQKPPGMILSVTGGGGVDSVQAGGGDFDASGWSAGSRSSWITRACSQRVRASSGS